MWIMLNNAFLSIVEASEADLKKAGIDTSIYNPSVWLSVRARKAAHISRIFPDAKVLTWPGRDYAARAYVPREAVERAMVAQVSRIDYGNFKNSVREAELHDAYADVWGIMWDYQNGDERAQESALSF